MQTRNLLLLNAGLLIISGLYAKNIDTFNLKTLYQAQDNANLIYKKTSLATIKSNKLLSRAEYGTIKEAIIAGDLEKLNDIFKNCTANIMIKSKALAGLSPAMSPQQIQRDAIKSIAWLKAILKNLLQSIESQHFRHLLPYHGLNLNHDTQTKNGFIKLANKIITFLDTVNETYPNIFEEYK